MILGIFHLYGLILGVAFFLAFVVVERRSRWFGIDPRWLERILFPVAICAVIGARLYHLVTDWRLYIGADLGALIAIWNGGLGFFGGLMGGMIGLILGLRQKGQHAVPTLGQSVDLLAFGIPLAQAVGRLGNYVNTELYGLPTTLPWGMTINGQRYHPLFAYEAILDLILFGVLTRLSFKKSLVLGKGQYAALYITGYSIIRFWLEFLRIDTAHFFAPFDVLPIAQWVALAGMVGGVTLFWVRRHAPKKRVDWSLE